MRAFLTGATGFLGSHPRSSGSGSRSPPAGALHSAEVFILKWDALRMGSAERSCESAETRVGFRRATTVFGDPFAKTFPDAEHSADEQRFLTIGASVMGRLLVVAHAERNEAIRIISVRPTTPHERRFYEEEH